MTEQEIKNEALVIKKEVQEKTLGYVTAGLGIVAGLAWNEAIKGLIELVFPLDQNSLAAKFIYALIVTLAIVIASHYLGKAMTERKKEEKKGL